jgi:hypothetical protein
MTLLNIRTYIVNKIPEAIKIAFCSGLGLFFIFIALKDMNIVVFTQNAIPLETRNFTKIPAILGLVSFLILITLVKKNIKAAVLISIITTTILGILFGDVQLPEKLISLPNSPLPSLMQTDFAGLLNKNFIPMVRPPRLGGNKLKGVFATRSPNRPNNIGLSCVKLLEIKNNNGKISLIIEGADLVNNTPIIDIKPYIGFVDSIKDARSGYATVEPPKIDVLFSDEVLEQLSNISIENFKEFISEVLSQDPRPAYKQKSQSDSDRVYGVQLYDYNVQWKMLSKDTAFVVNIAKV